MAEEKKLSRIIEIKDQYTSALNKYRQQLKGAKKDTDDLTKSVDDANKTVSKTANTSKKKSDYVFYDPKQIEAEMNAYTKAREQIKKKSLSSDDREQLSSEISKIRSGKIGDTLPSFMFTKKDEENHKKMGSALDDIAKKGKKADDNMPGSTKMSHSSGLSGLIYKLGMLQMGFFSVQMAISGIGEATGAVINDVSDRQKALTTIQNKNGMTKQQAEQYKGSISDVYKDGYGASKEEISGIMADVNSQLGNTKPDDMTGIVKSIYAIQNTWKTDESDVIKGIANMNKEFGTTTKEATNLMVQGMQNGLNSNGDFFKQMSDSAKSWKDLGFSASEAINMQNAGVKSGSFEVGDINNAIKQLDDRSRSGDNKKAFTMLGLNQKQTKANLNAGGDVAKQTTMDILKRLSQVTDSSKQYQIGKELFGDQWKNISSEAIQSLLAFDDSINTSKSSLDDLMNNTNTSLGDEFKKTFRDLHEAIQPIEESLTPTLQSFDEWIKESFTPTVKEIIKWTGGDSTSSKIAKQTTKFGIGAEVNTLNPALGGAFKIAGEIKDIIQGKGKVDGNQNGRKAGIRRVPYDNYYTFLHEGETVLTKRESEDLVHSNGSSGSGSSIAIAKLADQIVIREESDIDKITTKLVQKLQSNQLSFGGVN